MKDDLNPKDIIEVTLCPFGECPVEGKDGENVITQIFDKQAFAQVLSAFYEGEKDVLVDVDHNAETGNSTEAAGWIKEMWVDDKEGLKGKLLLTDLGAELLNNLKYRFSSPAFLIGEDGRPAKLVSWSLTNKNRIDNMPLVYNSTTKPLVLDRDITKDITQEEADKEPEDPVIEETKTEKTIKEEEVKDEQVRLDNPDIKDVDGTTFKMDEGLTILNSNLVNNTEGTNTIMNEKLINILGLPKEATEEDIINSVKEFVDKVKSIAEEEVKEEAQEFVENECGDMNEEDKKMVQNSYISNKDLTMNLVKTMKNRPNLIVNSATAEKPELDVTGKLKESFKLIKDPLSRAEFLIKNGKNMK